MPRRVQEHPQVQIPYQHAACASRYHIT
jgi:hypothetical protein